jgi:hypothetical protein
VEAQALWQGAASSDTAWAQTAAALPAGTAQPIRFDALCAEPALPAAQQLAPAEASGPRRRAATARAASSGLSVGRVAGELCRQADRRGEPALARLKPRLSPELDMQFACFYA